MFYHWILITQVAHDQDDQEHSSTMFLLLSQVGNSTQCKLQYLSRGIQMHWKSSTGMWIYNV